MWEVCCLTGEADKKSGIFPENNLENLAWLGNVVDVSREVRLGVGFDSTNPICFDWSKVLCFDWSNTICFDWTNPLLTIPTRFSSSCSLETTAVVLSCKF